MVAFNFTHPINQRVMKFLNLSSLTDLYISEIRTNGLLVLNSWENENGRLFSVLNLTLTRA